MILEKFTPEKFHQKIERFAEIAAGREFQLQTNPTNSEQEIIFQRKNPSCLEVLQNRVSSWGRFITTGCFQGKPTPIPSEQIGTILENFLIIHESFITPCDIQHLAKLSCKIKMLYANNDSIKKLCLKINALFEERHFFFRFPQLLSLITNVDSTLDTFCSIGVLSTSTHRKLPLTSIKEHHLFSQACIGDWTSIKKSIVS